MGRQEQLSRASVVRDVLLRLGAIQDIPAQGWHSKAMKILDEKGIHMHPQTVYGVRARALKNLKKQERLAGEKPVPIQEEAVSREGDSDQQDFLEIKVAELLAMNEFANNFGGYDRVRQALKALEALDHRS